MEENQFRKGGNGRRIMKGEDEEDDTRCEIGEEVQYRGWWGTWFIRTDLLSLVQRGSSVHIS